jgi:transposase
VLIPIRCDRSVKSGQGKETRDGGTRTTIRRDLARRGYRGGVANSVPGGAASRRAATTAGLVREVGLPLIEQPPYAPELNPAERVFELLRAGIEGIVYPSLEEKIAAVEAILAELDADSERIRSLTGWRWIVDALQDLPKDHAA